MTALILVYERLVKPIPKKLFFWIVLVFFVFAATFAAWRDAYLSMKGREADQHRLELELIDVKKSRPLAEEMRQGLSEALQDSQQPDFTFHPTYNPATHEIALTLSNVGKSVARSVSEDRWVEVGKLSFTPRLDRPRPDVKFTPFYTTKKGFTVIPSFVPTAGFLGGSEDLGDVGPGTSVGDHWIDQTPQLLAAIKADRSGVLRYMGTLKYNYGNNASQRGVYGFCFEVRLFTVGAQVKSNDRVLFRCEQGQ